MAYKLISDDEKSKTKERLKNLKKEWNEGLTRQFRYKQKKYQ